MGIRSTRLFGFLCTSLTALNFYEELYKVKKIRKTPYNGPYVPARLTFEVARFFHLGLYGLYQNDGFAFASGLVGCPIYFLCAAAYYVYGRKRIKRTWVVPFAVFLMFVPWYIEKEWIEDPKLKGPAYGFFLAFVGLCSSVTQFLMFCRRAVRMNPVVISSTPVLMVIVKTFSWILYAGCKRDPFIKVSFAAELIGLIPRIAYYWATRGRKSMIEYVRNEGFMRMR